MSTGEGVHGPGDASLLSSGILRRPRLFRLLDTHRPALCVLAAPSGYGKTTVVRDWIDSHPAEDAMAVVWVPLFDETPSVLSFWDSVALAAERAGYLTPDQGEAIQHAGDVTDRIVRLMARYLPRGAHVVLDAFENTGDLADTIATQLVNLTQRAPDLHVIITTRAADVIATRSRVLRDQVRLVTHEDLAFTAAEVFLLMNNLGRGNESTALYEITHGYPLAVRAATVSTRHVGALPTPADGSSSEWPADVSELFSSQAHDPELLDFVRSTVIPPFFDLELAAAISAESAQTHIATLSAQGFGRWIPFAAGREVFQYVDSFRDAMLRTAHASVDGVEARERIAAASARWFLRNGLREQALALAIEANAFDMAERITVELLLTMPEMHNTNRVGGVLSRIPVRRLTEYPAIAFAIGLAHFSDPLTRASATQFFEIVNARIDVRAPHPDQRLTLLTVLSVSQRLSGNFEAAGETARRGWEEFRQLSIRDREVLGPVAPVTIRALAYSVLQAGDGELASEMLHTVLPSSGTATEHSFTLAYASGIDAIQGHNRIARKALSRLDEDSWPRRHDKSYVNLISKVGEAYLALDALDWRDTIDILERSIGSLETPEFWPFANIPIMRARMALGHATTEAPRIHAALEASPPPPGVGENLGTASLINELALLWLAVGNPARASDVLERTHRHTAQTSSARIMLMLMRGDASGALREATRAAKAPGHTMHSRAALALLASASAARTGQNTLALDRLGEAWSAYTAHGVRSCVLLLPHDDRDRLRVIAATSAVAFERLVPEDTPAPFDSFPETVELSGREHAVLQLLASGESSTITQIATQLFVSPNTVKTQLRSLYRKLGVDGREKAVQRASELDLL